MCRQNIVQVNTNKPCKQKPESCNKQPEQSDEDSEPSSIVDAAKASTSPLWTIKRPFPPEQLNQNKTCDTVIIGGGIAGLAIAYELTTKGQSIVLVEANELGTGSTGWCGGILSTNTTVEFSDIEDAFGFDAAKHIANSLQNILSKYKAIFGSESQWQYGSSYCLGNGNTQKVKLEEEEKVRKRFALPGQMKDSSKQDKFWPKHPHVLELPREHAIHPVKFSFAIAQKIKSGGGQICEYTSMHSWLHDGENFSVNCGTYTILAKNLILCTGYGKAKTKGLQKFQNLLLPITGHALVTEPSSNVLELMQSTDAIAMWDSLILYHYIHYLPDGRMLIGGEDLPYATKATEKPADDKHIQNLYTWAQKAHGFPLPKIEQGWSATMIIPYDGMPVLSREQVGRGELIEIVTDGLPGSLLLADTVKDIICLGKESITAKILSPERKVSLPGRIFALFKQGTWARKLACKLAFIVFNLKDRWL